MNILVLNGSPKGEKSNTLKLTKAFLDGMNSDSTNIVDIVDISKSKIEHCVGCFNCWSKTPGKCIIKDDMELLTQKYIEADLIIWSFPLYYFGMPSKIKAFLDRLLPTNLPFINNAKDGSASHPTRYDLSNKKYMLISTCGFHSVKNNYEALLEQFRILYKNNFKKIICCEGELLKIDQLRGRVEEYLEYVFGAGVEYSQNFDISKETETKLSELLFPADTFIKMANASWDISNESSFEESNGERVNKSNPVALNFMKQMQAVYTPEALKREELILEFYFTDIKETYQFILHKDTSELLTNDLKKYTTRIETSFELWTEISRGKVNGAEAMMQKRYKVLGEFDTMLSLDQYFGSKTSNSNKKKRNNEKKTNMNFLIMPWMILWIFLSINNVIAGVLGILISVLIPLVAIKYKLTIYDKINSVCISSIGILSMLNIDSSILLPMSYIVFGGIWAGSCFIKIPLTANYSINDYENSNLISNPLFLKTNRILTFLWSLTFFATALNIVLTTKFNYNNLYSSLIKVLILGTMIYFTKWFSKWYPKKVARG